MTWTAVAIGGSTAVGLYGAKQAAGAQSGAAGQAAQLSRDQLNEDIRRYNEMAPYRTAGIGAVTDLSGIINGGKDPTAALEASPGYQFRLSQGTRAIDRFLSSRGNRLGGAALKAGIQYNQDFGSNEYQNMLNNKFKLAGFSGTPTPAPDTSNISNAIMAGGQAQANMYGNYSNVANQALNNYTTYRTYNDLTNKIPTTGSANINTWSPPSYNLSSGTTYGMQ